jgi:cell division protein FtsX
MISALILLAAFLVIAATITLSMMDDREPDHVYLDENDEM